MGAGASLTATLSEETSNAISKLPEESRTFFTTGTVGTISDEMKTALALLPEAARKELEEKYATAKPPKQMPTFPCEQPMRVMMLEKFLTLDMLLRSDAADGHLRNVDGTEEFAAIIFISHSWWHRPEPPAEAAPDRPDNLKFSTLCKGLQALVEREKLDTSRVALWCDWFSIDQVDAEKKVSGVRSMIHYTTRCSHMLIPVPSKAVVNNDYVDGEDPDDYAAYYPEDVADYGSRGWCRVEYFLFGLYSEMRDGAMDGASPLKLFAVGGSGELQQFKVVEFLGGDRGDMPSQGAFSFESDRESIVELESKMISAFGHAVIRNAADSGEPTVDLGAKMLRDEHLPTLRKAIEEGKFKSATTLSLNACPEITTMPDLNGMDSLRTLTLINAHSLQSLPDLSALPALKVVKLENCDKLKELPKLPAEVTWDACNVPEHLKGAL